MEGKFSSVVAAQSLKTIGQGIARGDSSAQGYHALSVQPIDA